MSNVETEELTREQLGRRLLAIGRVEIDMTEAEAAMNREIDAVKARYGPKIERLAASRNELVVALEGAVRASRKTLFKGASKTVSVVLGKVGFRAARPSVGTRKGFTLEEIVESLRHAEYDHFLRERVELNKDRIGQAIQDGEVGQERLRNLGITFRAPAETFYHKVDHASVRDELAKGR